MPMRQTLHRMRWMVLLVLLASCGGEPIELKANGLECSDSAECASGCCGTASINPAVGACMPAYMCGG